MMDPRQRNRDCFMGLFFVIFWVSCNSGYTSSGMNVTAFASPLPSKTDGAPRFLFARPARQSTLSSTLSLNSGALVLLGRSGQYLKKGQQRRRQKQQLHQRPLPRLNSVQRTKSATSLGMMIPRGGATVGSASNLLSIVSASPQSLFNAALLALGACAASLKILPWLSRDRGGAVGDDDSNTDSQAAKAKPPSIVQLQRRFLAVFWLLRCADWLQGPYFYEVYASKVFGGVPASMALVSRLFLTGFASTALFGPVVGRAADQYGRRRATLAFSLVYAAGALSTKSPMLAVLFAGRILSGIGTSLLFSAPESWLVGASHRTGDDPDGAYLGETFGLAYAGDSLVAIAAGQMAGSAASLKGPTGPFELSTLFLAAGGFLAAFLWKENRAESTSSSSYKDSKPTIRDAVEVVRNDPKILQVGAVQSLFEAAMYIFVLQWPPAVSAAIRKAFSSSTETAGTAIATPFGAIFSCFMACSLLGSTIFGQLAAKGARTERFLANMLLVATTAMTAATWTLTSLGSSMLAGPTALAAVTAAFFVFEACVGMYFPSIGTLRSKYVPDSHRSVIMNLFGIPLNVLVVSVFLSISKLGLAGALGVSSMALAVATACMFALKRGTGTSATAEGGDKFARANTESSTADASDSTGTASSEEET